MTSQSNTFSPCHAADEDLTPVLHRTMLSLVRRRGADLTAHQLAVFLSVYMGEGPHTVRGLAARLHICKPAVTRALDRLEEMGLARREADPRDRRSVVAQGTDLGWKLVDELRRAVGRAAPGAAAKRAPAPAAADGPGAWRGTGPANRTDPGGHGPAASPWRG